MLRGRKNHNKIVIIVSLFVACVTISVGYASFSSILNISGSAKVNKASWEIKFINLSSPVLTGDAVVDTANPPKISSDGTTISSYNVSFTSPGDSVTYTFDVQNSGTFNAKLSSINIPVPTCTGTGENAVADANNVCGNLRYNLTYADGSKINVNDTLDTGDTRNLKLSLVYYEDLTADELPHEDVMVSNLSINMTYAQY